MLFQVYKCLIEKIEHIPGAKVENNKFCLSVHYRCVEEKVRTEFYGLPVYRKLPFRVEKGNDLCENLHYCRGGVN